MFVKLTDLDNLPIWIDSEVLKKAIWIKTIAVTLTHKGTISCTEINTVSAGMIQVMEKPKTIIEMLEISVREGDKTVYFRFGKKYRKLDRAEIIQKGAVHSLKNGELYPLAHEDTVGKTPSEYPIERDFYNPIGE